MENSINKLLEQIIEESNCPFTKDEVHGFFCGIVLSGIDRESIFGHINRFLDIGEDSKEAISSLVGLVSDDLKKNSFSLLNQDSDDLNSIINKFSEWTYYFLIAVQLNSANKINDPKRLEIMDVFDEISQLNEKYILDKNHENSLESLNDINKFIAKSIVYLSNSNNDTTNSSKNQT